MFSSNRHTCLTIVANIVEDNEHLVLDQKREYLWYLISGFIVLSLFTLTNIYMAAYSNNISLIIISVICVIFSINMWGILVINSFDKNYEINHKSISVYLKYPVLGKVKMSNYFYQDVIVKCVARKERMIMCEFSFTRFKVLTKAIYIFFPKLFFKADITLARNYMVGGKKPTHEEWQQYLYSLSPLLEKVELFSGQDIEVKYV